MYVEGIGPTYGETSPYTRSKEKLGRDDFLNLLITQLKHQNPLNPVESTEFAAQLAQFSSLEQLFGVNEALTDIQETLSVQENGNVLDYIGKVVKTSNNMMFIKDSQMDSSAYTLEGRANVTISIYNYEGVEVRKIYAGWKDAGEHDLVWDGRDNNGVMVGDGIYGFELDAMDEDGLVVPYNTYHSGEVTGVTYQGSIPYLMIGNKLVAPENIIEVRKAVSAE
jgi:flagellar basal-body rod modification protein FlgD